jgi:hypothetical protein
MFDFRISGLEFSATTIIVVAKTAAARDWFARHVGDCVVSSTFRKSSAGDVLESIQKAGLTFEQVAA